MISHTRQILYSTSSHHHHGVFLEIMLDTRYICQYFSAIWEPDFCNLSLSGVRFFGFCNIYLETDSSFEGRGYIGFFVHIKFVDAKHQCRWLRFVCTWCTTVLEKLVDSWHKKCNLVIKIHHRSGHNVNTIVKVKSISRASQIFLSHFTHTREIGLSDFSKNTNDITLVLEMKIHTLDAWWLLLL